MLKNILLFSFFLVNFQGFSGDFGQFLKILGRVESNNNDAAIGDNGLARGRYQIHKVYFIDAQQYDKSLKQFNYQDVTNKIVADKVVKAYMDRYCPGGTWEQMARCHNSGPGWRNKYKLTEKYWNKFKMEARQIQNYHFGE